MLFATFVCALVCVHQCIAKGTLLSLKKPSTQSSIGWKGAAARAVDGNTNQKYFGGNSCTHTLKEQGAWWQVDLEEIYVINEVVIYNRADCCGDRLSQFKVIVSETGKDNFKLCKSYTSPTTNGMVLKVVCSTPLIGRYVKIEKLDNNFLTLCEVQVKGNDISTAAKGTLLSMKKPSTQSSVGWNGVPARAVDGNTNQNYFGRNSCSHTLKEQGAWWQVDLEEIYAINEVVIYNREDCCGDRLSQFKVIVSENGKDNFKLCKSFTSPTTNGMVLKIDCSAPLPGRYVRIEKLDNNLLTLCEVQVYGNDIMEGSIVSKNKQTMQSSVGWEGIPDRAVDDNTNQHYFEGKSCSHTLLDQSAWWQVDLGSSNKIYGVVIYNRMDCCGNRLSNFFVKVSDHLNDDFKICATYTKPTVNGEILIVTCKNPLQGRYVRIEKGNKEFLTLCEVKVYGDTIPNTVNLQGKLLSHGKPAMQSSVGWDGIPGRAVDGNKDQAYYGSNSCTHTKSEARAWWQVDLGQPQKVYRVVIYNRKDCCSERLATFAITVSGSSTGLAKKCINYKGGYWANQILHLQCDEPVTGRFVKIQLADTNFLTLCEVEVYGEPGPAVPVVEGILLSLKKPATQSSVGWQGVPARAIDGKTEQGYYAGNTCSHTKSEKGAWWQVDLGSRNTITRVVIYNRGDCCGERLADFRIKVSDSPTAGFKCCVRYPGITWNKQVLDLSCDKTTVGRYVRIQLEKTNMLTLCEVQVYGTPLSIDGQWSNWGSFGKCSSDCIKDGVKSTQKRQRKCNNPPPSHGGKACAGSADDEQVCKDIKPCAVDGQWSDWGSFGKCSSDCIKDGVPSTKKRQRHCNNPAPSHGGKACAGSADDEQVCQNVKPCAVDGHWSDWERWGQCSSVCIKDGVPSTKKRQRHCNNPAPSHGGKACAGSAEDEHACQDVKPCAVDGQWSNWGNFGQCSSQCVKDGIPSTKKRQRQCNNPAPSNGGSTCAGAAEDEKVCQEAKPCPVDGQWGNWNDWSSCSSECTKDGVPSVKKRQRQCNNPAPSNGGKSCIGSAEMDATCQDVKPCKAKDCMKEGEEYLGSKITTSDGIPCQRWDEDTPNKPNYWIRSMGMEERKKLGNFCRQPAADPDAEPWCYTADTNSRWGYCGVPAC